MAPIHAARARSARRLALAKVDDQPLTQLADRQGMDRVIDRLATGVGVSEAGNIHAAQFAGILLGDKRSRSIRGTNSMRSLPGNSFCIGRHTWRRACICCWATRAE